MLMPESTINVLVLEGLAIDNGNILSKYELSVNRRFTNYRILGIFSRES